MPSVPKPWENRWTFEHLPPKSELPTMVDLPSEDPQQPGLPDDFHLLQPRLLSETFRPDPELADTFYTAADINLYYDPHHTARYKRPDWLAVLGVPQVSDQSQLRLSYVIWQEEIAPYLIVELLSPGTEAEDLGTRVQDVEQPPRKWDVYERFLQVPYYATYSRYTRELRPFGLVAGRYRRLDRDEAPVADRPGLWLPEAGIGLGVWPGTYEGVRGEWLRFFDASGHWLQCSAERLAQERQRAEQEAQRAEQQAQRAEQQAQRAEQQAQRADRLAERLRALGIDPGES
jgi:Uma2 family endonuclease